MTNSNNKDDLSAKDTASLLTEWKRDYAKVLSDVTTAVSELNAMQGSYQKSFYTILKNNFPTLILFIAFILFIAAANYIDAPFKVQFGSFIIEKSQACKPSAH